MEYKRILKWEMWGILLIFSVGAFLHFAYELSSNWKPLALVSAVNESAWEHLKIAFWPAFIYGVIEFFVFGKLIKNFFFAKATSFLITPVLIVIIFYSYTSFTGTSILPVDISTFFVAIAIAQIVGYRVMLVRKNYPATGMIIVVITLLAFCSFTYFPPKFFIFKDPITSGYGLVK